MEIFIGLVLSAYALYFCICYFSPEYAKKLFSNENEDEHDPHDPSQNKGFSDYGAYEGLPPEVLEKLRKRQ